jgi:hypothetical protein
MGAEDHTAEHSFDELARGLASGSVSRGKALRLMGAALVGGALASIPGVAQAIHQPCPETTFQCGSGHDRTCCPTGWSCCKRGRQLACCPPTTPVCCSIPNPNPGPRGVSCFATVAECQAVGRVI